MKFDKSLRLVLLALVIFENVSGFGPKKLYTINLPSSIVSVNVVNKQLILVGPYYIAAIDKVHYKFIDKSRMNPRVINKDIPNPREVGKIPVGTFKEAGNQQFYWVTSRGTNFTDGAVYVMKETVDYSAWQDISVDSGWNYEKTQWVDMDRDGLKDCLTARYRGGVGQMLWFKQPGGQTDWGQKIIHQGMADGNFLGFVYDKKTYILVAGTQFNTLGLYWTLQPRNNWILSAKIRHRVIDNYGKYFDVQYIDLNKDGRPDVLTTTIQIANSRGQVLGYEVPLDIQNKIWKRRVLAAGFTGEYSPGKATAFWANKWKRKTDRPNIFLSGGGEEKLYILSPVPKRSGFGYIKSSLVAGTGVIGIPYIVDLNGDSYPEIFVPQGNQLHVFSYDYSSSAADAKPDKSTPKKTTPRPAVNLRPPYFRPTTPAPKPAIPAGVKPGGALPDTSSLIPKPIVIPDDDNTGSNNRIPGNSRPLVPQPPRIPAPLPPQRAPAIPQSPRNPAQLPPQRPPAIPARPRPPNPNSQVVPLQRPNVPQNQQPVLGSDGRLYQPINPDPNQIILYPYQNQVYEENITQGPVYESPVPNIVVLDNSIPATTSLPDYEPINLAPPNLLISITPNEFSYWSEANDACRGIGRKLCSLNELQNSKAEEMGPIPYFQWGWFDIQNRAATLDPCEPGQNINQWEGFLCYNGEVGTLPIRNDAQLPALCCGQVVGANSTSRRFSHASVAANQCQQQNAHLCSIPEMFDTWIMSTYKGPEWKWFAEDNRLIRMTHHCDIGSVLWTGYSCLAGRLETTQVYSFVQEQAFCCPNRSTTLKISLNIIVVALLCTMSLFL